MHAGCKYVVEGDLREWMDGLALYAYKTFVTAALIRRKFLWLIAVCEVYLHFKKRGERGYWTNLRCDFVGWEIFFQNWII